VSDKPAVIRAEFTDYRPVKTRKTLILSFEIPAEEQGAAFAALGYPVMGSSIWVAIARLQEGASAPTVPEKPAEPAPVEKAKAKRFDELPRSQQAALKLRDGAFVTWIRNRYCDQFGLKHGEDVDPNRMLKVLLGIDSKRELDNPASGAVAAFDRLLTSFEFRDQVRA